MTSILIHKENKKNGISKIYNSNKNIFIKKEDNYKKDNFIYHNDLHDKIILNKNSLYTNTSVKKMKQIKKISINDNENKRLFIKNDIHRNNKIMAMKKHKTMRCGRLLDSSSNKENHGINNKEKSEIQKTTQKNVLQNIVNATKIKIKQNLPKTIQKDKDIKINKFSTYINNSDNLSNIIKNKEDFNNKSLNLKNKLLLKRNENKYNSIRISYNKSTIIEKEEEIKDKDIINSKNIEYTSRYDRKHMSEKKIHIKSVDSEGNIIPIVKMKKEHIKYSIKKNREKSNTNLKNRKLIYEDDYNKNFNLKKYNSINNELENSKSYISLINNYDIINIINKKEETKKLSSSIKNKPNLMNKSELTKKVILHHYNSNILNFQKVNLSTKFDENNKNNKSIYINKEKEKINLPMTMRNKNNLNDFMPLSFSDKDSYRSDINNNLIQNKWDKTYFIPIVSASLIKPEEKEKVKNNNNSNNNIINYKKINNKDSIINDLNKDKYNQNNKKPLNFGDNNKKKREMLFNFTHKKIKNGNRTYNNFNSKRTNSFIYKRNKHITERNNSINNIHNNNNISLNDLNIQEKKLELIRNEISKEKMNKNNNYSISMDKICDNYFDINIREEAHNQQNKKYKKFHLKVNSLNIIRYSNSINGQIGDSMIVRRGDLLNRLRNIKHNFSEIEKEKN